MIAQALGDSSPNERYLVGRGARSVTLLEQILPARDYSWSAQADREHPRARSSPAEKALDVGDNSRCSDACCASNSSSGISGPWNIVKL